jgi:hypothetical protein
MPEKVPCPECGAPARITERYWLESTDGPVEHLKVGCVHEPLVHSAGRDSPVRAACRSGSRAGRGSELIGLGAHQSPLISVGARQVSGMAGVTPIFLGCGVEAKA